MSYVFLAPASPPTSSVRSHSVTRTPPSPSRRRRLHCRRLASFATTRRIPAPARVHALHRTPPAPPPLSPPARAVRRPLAGLLHRSQRRHPPHSCAGHRPCARAAPPSHRHLCTASSTAASPSRHRARTFCSSTVLPPVRLRPSAAHALCHRHCRFPRCATRASPRRPLATASSRPCYSLCRDGS
jgi:hypothetical protein